MRRVKVLMIFSILLLINGCIKRENGVTVKVPPTTTHNPVYTTPRQTNTTTTYGAMTIPNYHPPREQPVVIRNDSPFNNVESRPPAYTIPRSRYLGGAYRNNYKLKSFIDKMVSKYNYDRYTLNTIFSSVNRDEDALDKYLKPTVYSKTTYVGAWDKYRANFLTPSRINNGVAFWRENIQYLNKASKIYGVAPEYIIGIIGVETNFGSYTGTHSVLNALTTLALEYKKRSKFFTGELESYVLMLRDEKLDPQQIKGSYAGAFGLSQFMPTAFRQHAVDFNGDGHINLFNKADAIGSIAKYFVERGKWDKSIPVTMKVNYNKKRFYGLATGFKTNYSQRHLLSLGMRPTSNFYGYRGDVSLIKLSRYDRDELWWGTKNFYAITRYNPKDFYAMAVHQLAQAVKKAYFQRR